MKSVSRAAAAAAGSVGQNEFVTVQQARYELVHYYPIFKVGH